MSVMSLFRSFVPRAGDRAGARAHSRGRPSRVALGLGVGFCAVAVVAAQSVLTERGSPASAYTRTWTAHHHVMANPALEPGCGLDVGLLIDRSGSIANAGAEEHVRAAARTFIDAFAGTPSRIGVWSFGTGSAAMPGDVDHPAALLTDVGGSNARAGATALKTTVDSIPYAGSAATNWDAGFRAVHEASVAQGAAPDLLLVLTDGQPTVSGSDPELPDPFTEDADIDAGIAAANLVKADGTRVFAVGIGADIDTAALSLISGGTPWVGTNLATADYATTSFEALAATLHDVVTELCGGTVTVHKVVRDGAGDERPEAGWQFELAPPALGDEKARPPWAGSGTTDDMGAVQFAVAGVATERVSIHEVGQPGVELLADEIVCDNSSGRQPVLTHEEAGVSFDLGPSDVIACTFPNLRQPIPESTTTTSAPPTTTPPTTPPAKAEPVAPTSIPPEPPPAAAPATVLVKAQPSAASGALPRTGMDMSRLIFAGLCLIAGGGLVVVGLRPAGLRPAGRSA